MTALQREPIEHWPPRWMAVLELAQARLGRAAVLLTHEREPSFDLSDAAAALRRALGAVYDAYDQRDERLAALRRATVEARAAQHALAGGEAILASAAQAIGEAVAQLTEADRLLASRPLEPRPTEGAPELRASGDVPRLHSLDRPSLVPLIKVADPITIIEERPREKLPRPTTYEELGARIAQLKERAEQRKRPELAEAAPASASPAPSPPGFVADIPRAKTELEVIRDRTREMFEEVAMVGMQRAPLLGDPWRSATILERRMLRAIDAIVSMGPRALGLLEELSLDAPVKDPSRLFALAMTLGCLRGRDALAVAERTLFDYELTDPSCRSGLIEALKLVPHDLVPLSLRTLLASSDERHRALAIDVLAYRGLAGEADLTAASSDVPMVAAAALPHLGVARSQSLRELVDAALARNDPELSRAAWLAGALGNHPRIRETLRAALDDRDAAVLLAITGEQDDAKLLLDRMRAAPSSALIDAVGWAGSIAAFAPLLALLEHDDEKLRLSAAYALERLTGAELHDEVEIEAEAIVVDEPPDPDVGEPRPVRLALVVSDGRDAPPSPAPEMIWHPTTDPARWRDWYERCGAELPAGRRYRRGRPYTPSVSLWELDVGPCTLWERRALQRELCIRSGGFVRFDPHDFVPTQEAALAEWAPVAQRASSQPGSWHRPMPR